jgi:carboxyl-terminal processing protease
VVSPMEGSPAETAGIRSGDAIVKIEGKFTKEFSLVDAIKRLRGPKGSPITISVLRKGISDLLDFTLVRDKIAVRSVRSRYLQDGFGYVRLSQFMETSAEDIKKALARLTDASPEKKIKGLILDMRNNPGGLLTQAILIGDLFLDDGVIVYTDGRDKEQRQKFFARQKGTEPHYPIVVLVNGGSASAAEIVSGALKDHGRALIVGSQTFGKGSVQTITPLENGGAVTLTTALYYTKSGNSIQVQGVKPDIEILDERDDSEESLRPAKRSTLQLREGDLPGAIDNPSGLKEPGPTSGKGNSQSKSGEENTVTQKALPLPPSLETAPVAELLDYDKVLARGFEELRSFNVLKSDRK